MSATARKVDQRERWSQEGGTGTAPKNPFHRLPNALVRDEAIDAPTLVMLAERSTRADDRSQWGMAASDLRRICCGSGTGSGVGARSIRSAVEHGYLERHTRTRPYTDHEIARTTPHKVGKFKRIGGNASIDGKWQRAKDRLTDKATNCGASGNAGRMIWREWFNGRLSVNELAVFLFLRAGCTKGPAMEKDISARFGWSRPTTLKALRGLKSKGLVKAEQGRRNGKMAKLTYEPADVDRCLNPKFQPVKAPSNAASRNANPSNNRTSYCLPVLPTGELPSRTTSRDSRFSRKNATNFDWKDAWDRARHDQTLLGWVGDWSGKPGDVAADLELSSVSNECFQSVLEIAFPVIANGDMAKEIATRCGGRIAASLIQPAGLLSICWLAALKSGREDALSRCDAADSVDGMIQDIADSSTDKNGRPRHINSLALVGLRLAGEVYGGNEPPDCLYSSQRRQSTGKSARPRAPLSGTLTKQLTVLLAEDAKLGRILSPSLLLTPARHGLKQLLREFENVGGLPLILDVCREIIWGATIREVKPGAIKSWRYLRTPILQRLKAEEMERRGERPGDVLRAHKWAVAGEPDA
jgi:hypothetical protein